MKFGLIGAGGYVAPRHMKAIKDTGNDLIVASDPNDSVGVLDSYFPDCSFFTEIERFDRHLEKLRRKGKKIDYMSICSPNYLHDAHCRLAMRVDADVICEKPLVLKPHNLDQLKEIEKETGKRIYNVLQLRVHPSIMKLKEDLKTGYHNVDLTYITPRGPWYHVSWKGDESKSGGLVTNIGIHFFDMLIWVFGPVDNIELFSYSNEKVAGKLELKRAIVNWMLSIDKGDLPEKTISYRSIEIDKIPLRFDNVFHDLHTTVYERALEGKGFVIEDVKPSIEVVSEIRKMAK